MRFPAPLATVALLCGFVCGLAPSAAQAGPAAPAPGIPAAGAGTAGGVPSAAARSAALTQMTGLAPGQVTNERACPVAAPGEATCAAHVAVVRATGAPVRPRVHREHAVSDVRASRRLAALAAWTAAGPASAASPAASAPAATAGQPAPEAGTPGWLQQAYDLTYLSSTRGGNATIAVVDAYDDPTAASDLATFRSEYGLPPCAAGCFEKVNERGGTSSFPPPNAGWVTEESLDLDAISSLCPNCHIILVEAGSAGAADLSQAMRTAANLGATEVSVSWTLDSATPITAFATPTVPTIAATGDTGYLGSSGDAYPAAIPGYTAAGATTLSPAAGGARGYVDTAWSDTGSGCDLNESRPAYQPAAGCTGRAYADVSADGDPNTGLTIYNSAGGGWMLAGGTSLAAPLIAAYEAITGVDGLTPQWAYDDSALLNDPVSGTNPGSYGPCAAAIAYICTAGVGYDGPTGAGAISGQVTSGGPGIGGPTQGAGDSYVQSVTSTGAALVGGVYPNGNDTTYWWQYGTTTAYGEQTPAVDAGAGTAPVAVSGTFSDLVPATTYHYRLVASNSAGTTYGYDYTLTTPAAGPAPAGDQPASGSSSTGAGQSPAGGGSGASATTSSPGASASGAGRPASVPETVPVPAGSAPAPQPAPPPPARTAAVVRPSVAVAPRLTGAPRAGAVVTIRGGSFRNGSVTAVQFERCARTCRMVARGASRSHRLTAADAGYYIRARITVSGPGGRVFTWVAGILGPVQSPAAGSAELRRGATMIRGSRGRALVRVATSLPGARTARLDRARLVRARLVRARLVRARLVRARRAATVRFIRAAGSRGRLTVWACTLRAGAVVACTPPRAVRRQLSISLALTPGERVRLVAVG